MNKPSIGYLPFALATYFGIALLFHIPVVMDSSIPTDREGLIASVVFSTNTLLLQILGYLLAVVIINLLPFTLLLLSFRAQKELIQKIGISPATYFALTSLCFWISILAFNGIYFPRSAFSLLLPFGDADRNRVIGVITLFAYLALGVAPVAWQVLHKLIALIILPTKSGFRVVTGVGGVITTAILSFYLHYPQAMEQRTLHSRPNIIIIGIDSLSPLHLAQHPGKLPYLEAMLKDSAIFTNTITPLARTFPAWTSILTSQYPVHHGARFNLTRFDQVNNKQTLPRILKNHGYTTLYAQDERKFNNIDETFGFDTTIGPRLGAAEFILTKVSDQPVANLALMLPGSEWLFPFIKFNRADDIHYDPDEFVDAILRKLPLDNNKPLFLATHFCLAHYPYAWRTQGKATSENSVPLSINRQHIRALASLEKQIEKLVQGLRKQGRLDNTILVLLSDHGESLAYPDGLWPTAKSNKTDLTHTSTRPFYPVSTYSGHGGNILDRTQYQSVLAFRAFGALGDYFPAKQYGNITSLVDVMPTVLGAMGGVAPPDHIDGIDLIKVTKTAETDSRAVPAETGITFTSMASIVNLNENNVLREVQKYYAVDRKSARLFVKPDYYQDLVSRKDIAIHTKNWMLAFLRKDHNPTWKRVTLLIYKPTGEWTLGGNADLIERAPISLLVQRAKELYANEIVDFRNSWVFEIFSFQNNDA